LRQNGVPVKASDEEAERLRQGLQFASQDFQIKEITGFKLDHPQKPVRHAIEDLVKNRELCPVNVSVFSWNTRPPLS
jgi:hypothetical protein